MATYFLTKDDLLFIDNLLSSSSKGNYYATWHYQLKNYLSNQHPEVLKKYSHMSLYTHNKDPETFLKIYEDIQGKVDLEDGHFFYYFINFIKKENYKKLEEYFYKKLGYHFIAKKTEAILISKTDKHKYITRELYLKLYQWAVKEKYIGTTEKDRAQLSIVFSKKIQAKVAILKEIIAIFESYVKFNAWSNEVSELFTMALKTQKNIPVSEQKRIRKIAELLKDKFPQGLRAYFEDIQKEQFLNVESNFLKTFTINYNTILNLEQNQAGKIEIKNRVRRQSFSIASVINKEFSHLAKVLSRTEDDAKLTIHLYSSNEEDLNLMSNAILNYLTDITLKAEDRTIKEEFPIYFEKYILEKKFANNDLPEVPDEKKKNRKI